jgi:uncharacterized protein (TIGR02001 family)
MMSKKNWVLAAALMAATGTASANEFSSTITAASEYDFRGVSQSAKDPALQASLDFAADSGVYMGAWASNIDFGGAESVEIDGYIGWAYEAANGVALDIGVTRYFYPDDESDIDYNEFYAKVGYGNYGVEVWYSPDYGNSGYDTWYYAGTADFELAESWVLNLGLGYQTGQYFDNGWGAGPGSEDGSYWVYSFGVTKTWGNFDINLRYQGVDVPGQYRVEDDVFNNENRVIFSISTTLPWSK